MNFRASKLHSGASRFWSAAALVLIACTISLFGRMNGLLVLIMLPASLGAVVAASVYDMTGSYQWAWIILLLILAPAALFIRGITNGTAMVRGAKEQKSGASF